MGVFIDIFGEKIPQDIESVLYIYTYIYIYINIYIYTEQALEGLIFLYMYV